MSSVCPSPSPASRMSLPDDRERHWLRSFPHPRRLIVIGGKTSLWRFDRNVVTEAIETLQRKATPRRRLGYRRDQPAHRQVLEGRGPRGAGAGRFGRGSFSSLRSTSGRSGRNPRDGRQRVDAVRRDRDRASRSDSFRLSRMPARSSCVSRASCAASRSGCATSRSSGTIFDARGLAGTVECPRAGRLDISPIKIAVDAIHAVLDREQSLRADRSSVPLLVASCPQAAARLLGKPLDHRDRLPSRPRPFWAAKSSGNGSPAWIPPLTKTVSKPMPGRAQNVGPQDCRRSPAPHRAADCPARSSAWR